MWILMNLVIKITIAQRSLNEHISSSSIVNTDTPYETDKIPPGIYIT